MWEMVIGLEVHVELSTKTKIFCGCSTAFGAKPNTQCCPVCMGLPGALPVFNGEVLRYATMAAIAFNCEISKTSVFDRKNYFYPDLPKAYQISQLYFPIGKNGKVPIKVGDTEKVIRIHEMHMEEDAGKLIHSEYDNETYPDYNRCGVPLIEIVSEPDFRSSAEVIAYLQKIKSICEYLGISDCKMQEGSMRVDINLSVRKKGEETFGTRTETKNINSFRAIEHAIEHESARQIDAIESGERIIQQTRHWNEDKRSSYAMRSKENAQDYRYFPEPDLLPLVVTDEYIESVRASLPEMAESRKQRFMADYALSDYDASLLTASLHTAELFEKTLFKINMPKEIANWIIVPLQKLLNERGKTLDDLLLDADNFAEVISKVTSGKINRAAGMEILEAMVEAGGKIDVDGYIKEHSMEAIDDDGLIVDTVRKIVGANPASVAEYKGGKTKVLGFFVGQVMKELKGKANPAKVNEAILKELSK